MNTSKASVIAILVSTAAIASRRPPMSPVSVDRPTQVCTGFILYGLTKKLCWLKPELIEGLSTVDIIEL